MRKSGAGTVFLQLDSPDIIHGILCDILSLNNVEGIQFGAMQFFWSILQRLVFVI